MHARAPSLAYLPLKRRLDGLVRRAASIYSGEADTDTDEFHSAYSDVYSRTHVAPDRLSEKSALDNRSQKSAPSNVSRKSASSYISGSSALSNLSEKSAVLPVQLASLQRAVQSVQSMLRSINDSIVSDDSRMALAATKSKLAQQADVLMSTVAALNVGVSMLGSRAGSGEPSPRRAFVVTAKEPADGTGGLLRLLALPMALLFGRPRDALRVLSSLLARAVRIVVRRLRRLPAFQTLLLLAYKHTRIYAMVFWTGALLVWQANAAVIWANLSSSWQRGISF
ncbi:hypothetical protein IWW50_006772 [Coemansia erecta]|nr:hypothetical protein IWW50_006772 [Coemansia erecta]